MNDVGLKRCCVCEQYLPRNNFYLSKHKKDGLTYRCISCDKIYSRNRRESRTVEDREDKRAYEVNWRYGLSKEDYAFMLKEQDHKCKICGKDELDSARQRLNVDHCHTTGRIRGLLCHTCNVGLGMFKEDPDLLAVAINYLKE